MPYVVYHKDTTRYLCNHPGVKTWREHFATEGAAKAALTRELENTRQKQRPLCRDDFAISELSVFLTRLEKKETVKNLMSGKDVVQSVNTPLCCDPSSETYWSM